MPSIKLFANKKKRLTSNLYRCKMWHSQWVSAMPVPCIAFDIGNCTLLLINIDAMRRSGGPAFVVAYFTKIIDFLNKLIQS